MNLAPIVLFVYNRPLHTRKTVESLLLNAEAKLSDLFIYSDGPKSANETNNVSEVREYVKTLAGFRKIRVIEREENFGLARSVIEGVTEVCNKFQRVIVLEDDLIVSPYFLRYMNDGLLTYEANNKVASIHGYNYPVRLSGYGTFFLRGADCWGWATWQRAWDHFEADGPQLLQKLQHLRLTHSFDFDGSYQFTQMLADQTMGKNNSWAIRWYASAFLADMYTLYPHRSLVYNCGNDGSGTHGIPTEVFKSLLSDRPIDVTPIDCTENTQIRAKIAAYFRSIQRPSLKSRLMRSQTLNRVRKIIKKIIEPKSR